MVVHTLQELPGGLGVAAADAGHDAGPAGPAAGVVGAGFNELAAAKVPGSESSGPAAAQVSGSESGSEVNFGG